MWWPYCLKRLCRHLPDCRNVNAVALIIGFYSHSLQKKHTYLRIDILACYCSAVVSIESSIEACCVCIGPHVPLKSVYSRCVCGCLSVCETARVPGTCLSACWYRATKERFKSERGIQTEREMSFGFTQKPTRPK